MEAAGHELSQPDERVRGEREGESLIGIDRREGELVFEHEGAGIPLESAVGS